MDKKIS